MRRDVFQAIADPTRRDIINMIARQPLTTNDVATQFDMSRQAIAKHIKILSECGLLMVTQQGRERFCTVQADKLDEVTDWIDNFRKQWERRFDKLDRILIQMLPKSTTKK